MMKPDLRHAVFRVWTVKACCMPEDDWIREDDDPFDVMGFLRRSSTNFRSSFTQSSHQIQPHHPQFGRRAPMDNLDTAEPLDDILNVERPTTNGGRRQRSSVTFSDIRQDDDLPREEFELEEGSLQSETTTMEQEALDENTHVTVNIIAEAKGSLDGVQDGSADLSPC